MPTKVKGEGVEFPDNVLQTKAANNGPTFVAGGTGGMSTNTTAKVVDFVESVDTHNCFTNSRFTPNVEGFYQISAALGGAGMAANGHWVFPKIYKNGLQVMVGSCATGFTGGPVYWSAMVSGLIYLNGTTDYVECWAVVSGAPTCDSTFFNGCLVRALS